MNADAATEDREKSSAIIIAALVFSLAAHIALMYSLERCSFNTFSADAKHSRKWTRDLPTMHVVRHTGDPLATENERGRPTAAPVVESVQERVARLGEKPLDQAPALTDAAVAAPVAVPPPETKPAEWKVREKFDVLDHPVAAEEALPAPEVAAPDAPASVGADILPPADLPAVAALPAAARAAAQSKDAVENKGGLGFPSLAPPEIGSGPGASAAIDFSASSVALEAATAAVAAVEPPPQEKPPEVKPVSLPKEVPQPILPQVDEKVVKEEKKAVKELRDERPSVPFANHVNCGLDYWIDPQHPDFKYFRLRLSSHSRNPLEAVSTDGVYLLDASGSIANDRLKSCRKAVSEAIRTLNSNDRFNVVAFRDKFSYLFPAWREVDAKSVAAADSWLSNLTAHGRTDVFKTIKSVLAVPRSPARPLIAVVITDGDPTSGMTRSAEIISAFSELNDGLVAMYMYGVKEEANAYLMDMLTRENRGEWTRHSGMRWRAASGIPEFVAKFADPVLTDVSVTFAAASRVDAYPKRVTHLYQSGPIDVYGVCPASVKDLAFVVRGLNGAQACQDVFKLAFKDQPTLTSDVKKAWAQRRLYAIVGEYVRNPDPGLLRDLKLFSSHYGVAIPYEAELGKNSVRK
ncbi:MAG: VWA domain-containing protein [Kiritimatiellae bacterium]|nr:VWA domain-containing protein [Kiritimatiellia bacterium]